MIFLLAGLLAAAAPATAAPTGTGAVPTGRSTPHAVATTEDVAAALRARAVYVSLLESKLDRTVLTPKFSTELTPTVATILARSLAGLGEPTAFALRAKHHVDGATIYDYAVSLPAGAITVTMGIDDATALIARYYVRRTASAAR
ncbi:MAG: hypothetical protein NVS3B16_04810 [Vulcanimicrobiaceae bacterium]